MSAVMGGLSSERKQSLSFSARGRIEGTAHRRNSPASMRKVSGGRAGGRLPDHIPPIEIPETRSSDNHANGGAPRFPLPLSVSLPCPTYNTHFSVLLPSPLPTRT